jgi:hypothetical protein
MASLSVRRLFKEGRRNNEGKIRHLIELGVDLKTTLFANMKQSDF